MAIREGRWDCSTCGSTRIYGRHVNCPGCGHPRPAGVRFYLTDDAPVVVDPERLAEARAGADWICAHCGATSRATLAACGGCGAPRGSNPTQPVVDYAGRAPRSGDEPAAASSDAAPVAAGAGGPPSGGHGAPSAAPSEPSAAGSDGSPATSASEPPAAGGSLVPASSASPDVPAVPTAAAVPAASGADPDGDADAASADADADGAMAGPAGGAREHAAATIPVRRRRVRWRWVAVAGVLLLGMVRVCDRPYRYRPPEPVAAEVVGQSWRRTIILARLDTVVEGGWKVPEISRLLRTERRVHHHEDAIVGYDTVTREESRTYSVQDGYETVSEPTTERVATGSRTYVCGQRDLGNGYFEDRTCTEPTYETRTTTRTTQRPRYRQETGSTTVTERRPIYGRRPVYAPWYVYATEQYAFVDSAVATGATLSPQWPRVERDTTGFRVFRSTRHYVNLRTADSVRAEVTAQVDSAEWTRYRPGTRVAWRPNYEVLPADSLLACRRWHAGEGEPPPAGLGCSPRKRRR